MIGQTVSHYKVLEEIGAGGMGEVYKAEDTKLGRTVALKFLRTDLSRDAHAYKRFMHEARAASALEHPNICSIHEIETTPGGRVFICMSYCRGESLREVISRGPMALDEAVKIAVKVAEGLAAAHEAGVIHRDIKPDNIIITRDRGVKIIDFGLAKLAGASRLTKSGVTVGTISYKSPEQTRSEDVDGRTDVWSLGLVLFEMLTGQRAFVSDFEQAEVYSILNEKHRRVTDLRREVPVELERIIDRCLAKDPGGRYQSARELADELDRLADDLGWSRGSHDAHVPLWSRRRPRRIAASILAVAATLAVITVGIAGRDVLWKSIAGDRLPSEHHLAVLRFAGVGADPAMDAFSDGLMETLTSKITQLEQYQGTLWVVPASEIREREIESVEDARDAFNVNLVVTGSVQRRGSGYRLTINVVDAESKRQLKSALIDDPMKDASVFQDTTVVKLAEMLNFNLQPRARETLAAGGTSVASAYELYVRGRGYLQQHETVENIDRSIELFVRAIGQDSLYALAHAGLSEAYWRMYEETQDVEWVDRSKSACQKAIQLNDKLAPVHVTMGIINRGTGHHEEAIADFEKALELDPASYSARLELAIVYQQIDWIEKAEETYLEAIDLRPDYWAGYTNLGFLYYSNGQLVEAEKMFRTVTALTPENDLDNIRAYNNLIGIYYMLGDVEQSEASFRKSINIKPTADAYSNMGTVYIYEGRYADAVPVLEKAVGLVDKNPLMWGNLADAYRYSGVAGNSEKADSAYRRAISLAEEKLIVDPTDVMLGAILACFHAKLGQKDDAVVAIETVLEKAPDDIWILIEAVRVYEIVGKREEALNALATLVEAGGGFAEINGDPELVQLREDDQYQRMLAAADGKVNH